MKTHSSSHFISLLKLNSSWLPTGNCTVFLFDSECTGSITKQQHSENTPWAPHLTEALDIYITKDKMRGKKICPQQRLKMYSLHCQSEHHGSAALRNSKRTISSPTCYPVLSHKLQDTSTSDTMQVSKRASFQNTNTEDLFPPPQTQDPLTLLEVAVFSLRPSAAGEDRLKKATEREKGKKEKKNRGLAKKRERQSKKQEKEMQHVNS